MLLTGKAQKDFIKWLVTGKRYVYNDAFFGPAGSLLSVKDIYGQTTIVADVFRNALITEWLDSVGIYINVTPMYLDHKDKYNQGLFYSAVCFKDGKPTAGVDYDRLKPKLNRQEATEYAIIKSNQIFNESNNQNNEQQSI